MTWLYIFLFSGQSFRFPTSSEPVVIPSQKEGMWFASPCHIYDVTNIFYLSLLFQIFFPLYSLMPVVWDQVLLRVTSISHFFKQTKWWIYYLDHSKILLNAKFVSALRHVLMVTRAPTTSTTAHTPVATVHSAGTQITRCWFTERKTIMRNYTSFQHTDNINCKILLLMLNLKYTNFFTNGNDKVPIHHWFLPTLP